MARHRIRLAAWQEQVIAKADFLAHERVRLARPGRADDGPVHDATNQRLAAARRAAGVDGNRQPDGRSGMWGRIANTWTGARSRGRL
jgi:hypothetical protein